MHEQGPCDKRMLLSRPIPYYPIDYAAIPYIQHLMRLSDVKILTNAWHEFLLPGVNICSGKLQQLASQPSPPAVVVKRLCLVLAVGASLTGVHCMFPIVD
jgi:hypothetical protein